MLGKEFAGSGPRHRAELAELMLEEAEVAVVPGEAFGTPGYFRLSYALGDADLEEGVGRGSAEAPRGRGARLSPPGTPVTGLRHGRRRRGTIDHGA